MNSRDRITVSDKKKHRCLNFKGSLEVALSWMEDHGSQPDRSDCNSKIALIHLAKFKWKAFSVNYPISLI